MRDFATCTQGHQKRHCRSRTHVYTRTYDAHQLFAPHNSKEFTTSLSPRSWEKLTESKSKLREKTDKLLLRPDLDALAEVRVKQSA